jgi:Protein of unknown function (DUF3768)
MDLDTEFSELSQHLYEEQKVAEEVDAFDQQMRVQKIAELNDRFRKDDFMSRSSLGKYNASEIVSNLNLDQLVGLTLLVRAFDSFTESNDPNGEHDFGAVEFEGEKWFFKIDYYDPTFEFSSEDPSDPAQTRRVLTIMHRSEY